MRLEHELTNEDDLYVLSTLVYSCESWTIDTSIEKEIEALEMYFYRNILRIPRIQKITNVQMLNETEWLNIIKKRKLQHLDHVLRGQKYKMINEKRSVGRRQNS